MTFYVNGSDSKADDKPSLNERVTSVIACLKTCYAETLPLIENVTKRAMFNTLMNKIIQDYEEVIPLLNDIGDPVAEDNVQGVSTTNTTGDEVLDDIKNGDPAAEDNAHKLVTLVITSVFVLIDMSGSMGPWARQMRAAIRKYLRDMMKTLPANTMLYLWFFNKKNITIFEGLLHGYDMKFNYTPAGRTGLYRVQFYALEQMIKIQKAAPDGIHMPFIMMIMTDGKNNHKSTCKACDVVTLHANNVDIDRSLMVINGMDGKGLARELNIPEERLSFFERGQEEDALCQCADYVSMKTSHYQSMYSP